MLGSVDYRPLQGQREEEGGVRRKGLRIGARKEHGDILEEAPKRRAGEDR